MLLIPTAVKNITAGCVDAEGHQREPAVIEDLAQEDITTRLRLCLEGMMFWAAAREFTCVSSDDIRKNTSELALKPAQVTALAKHVLALGTLVKQHNPPKWCSFVSFAVLH